MNCCRKRATTLPGNNDSDGSYHAGSCATPKAENGKRKLSENEIRKFVRKNINQRECSMIIPGKGNYCKCGRLKSNHPNTRVTTARKTAWTPENHTNKRPADSFGTIQFTENSHEHPPYIRAEYLEGDEKTLENLRDLMKDLWEVSLPELVISVTGGADRFTINNSLKQNFKRGLIKAATDTGAWIVTGGTHAGVMKIVGEAVHDYVVTKGQDEKNVVALGIAPWGIINNKEVLISKDQKGCFPATYKTKQYGQKSSEDQPIRPALDPNHTHFILMDDGSENTFWTETVFRAKFEKFISKNSGLGVPVVSVVLEGGPGTLKTALDAVKEGGTPVVVVKGSGRAADFIAFGYNEMPSTGPTEQFHRACIAKAESVVLWETENRVKKIEDVVSNLKLLLKHKNMITVFSLEEDDHKTSDIHHAILHALFKASDSEVTVQFKLALSWNLCDIAKNKILDPKSRTEWQKKMNGKFGNEMLTKALIEDNFDFVHLLIDVGVDLDKFLTVDKLIELYNPENWRQCWNKKDQLQKDSPQLLKQIGILIHNLVKKQPKKMYKEDNVNDEICSNPERALFYWSLLLNRRQLAQYFWQTGKDQIGGALIASLLLQSLAEDAEEQVETELSEDLVHHSALYETHAVGVLNECYKKHKRRTHQLLTRTLDTWGDITLYSMANSAEKMQFMGHSACQTQLNQVWRGKMALHTSWLKILVCFFLPFLSLRLIDFTSDKDNEVHQNGKEKPDNTRKEQKKNTHTLLKVRYGNRGSKREQSDTIFFPKAAYLFYGAPIVKFGAYTLTYAVFLALFSYFVMVELRYTNITRTEVVLWVWVLTYFVEDCRHFGVFVIGSHSKGQKAKWYFFKGMKIFDVINYLTLILSIILRFTLHEDDFVWARMAYCTALLFYYLRFMKTFFVFRQIGPKIIMIKLMVYDLCFFLCILAVFIIAYGVFAHSLQFPNSELSWNLFLDPFYKPYWQIYGDLFLEELEGDLDLDSKNGTVFCKDNPKDPNCPQKNGLVLLLFAVYMMMTNVLLLNLLIAMFSYSFNRVQESSMTIWRYYRYNLIYEYNDRPTLAPPFIIFNIIFRIFRHFGFFKCHCCESVDWKHKFEFKDKLERAENERLTLFERDRMEDYLDSINPRNKPNTDKGIQTANKSAFESSEILLASPSPKEQHNKNDLEFQLKDELKQLQYQLGNQQQQLASIYSILVKREEDTSKQRGRQREGLQHRHHPWRTHSAHSKPISSWSLNHRLW